MNMEARNCLNSLSDPPDGHICRLECGFSPVGKRTLNRN